MLDVSLIFKIAGVAILLVVIDRVLEVSGKQQFATLANLVGLIIIMMMVVNLVSELFNSVKAMFQL
ncbi:stage III sporulation protein AC [Clostridium cellulovorans]|uniref:Stage III sporulation protein AC n=1 Tax=Clostridium cellulovorans (strain ATCC 35296 / DSM 3052 / OCM 3 / 743B) TaxID=573061 RepID=D9SLF3_CLOC7|nr:stage III sporulation protein AC [Clostridium cellulovorans]ADL51669.1 stage III sporulation protein AC [Clostridium cellulovorans 743B]